MGWTLFCLTKNYYPPAIFLLGRRIKGEPMNTQTEPQSFEVATKAENPMQERHCDQVVESVEMTAEAVLTARRLETKEEAGSVFVP